MICCPDCTCYFKLVTADLDFVGFDAGAPAGTQFGPINGGLFTPFYYDDDPAVPGYNPGRQVGDRVVAHSLDGAISACWDRVEHPDNGGDGAMYGSAFPTNYFVSGFFGNTRSGQFTVKTNDCAIIKCVYFHGTDMDENTGVGNPPEFVDTSSLTVPFTTTAEHGNFSEAAGVYTAVGDNNVFQIKFDGNPGAQTITAGGGGQSVWLLMADYYLPVRKCGDQFFDCDGLYDGEIFTAEQIELEGFQVGCCEQVCRKPLMNLPAIPCPPEVITQGVNEQVWAGGSNAVAHAVPRDIFTGPIDPNNGLPEHPNPADSVTVVPDWSDNTGGVGSVGANQGRWWGWIYIPQDNTRIQDDNGNTGERIRIWMAALGSSPQVIFERDNNTTPGQRGAGIFATLSCGWYFLGFEISDASIGGGVQIQIDDGLGGAFENLPAQNSSATQPRNACDVKAAVPSHIVSAQTSSLNVTTTPIVAVFASAHQRVATTAQARNCSVANTAVGQYTVTFSSAHPDGADYEVLFGVSEDASRDIPKVSTVDGSKTATGFNVVVTVDDNGAAADSYNDEPWSFAVLYGVTVVTGVTL